MTRSYTLNNNTKSSFKNVAESVYIYKKQLSWKTRIFFSLGHFHNDLCASIWFSYTLFYFQLQFPGNFAAALLLLGQVTDALSTPLIGYQSDQNSCRLISWYGKRKSWHLIGTVLVTFSFPFIFSDCIFNCSSASDLFKFIYYSIFIVFFQIGWAAVQVGHVSLMNDLTTDSVQRIELNAFRQAFTVGSSILVYTLMLVVLGLKEEGTIRKEDNVIFTKVVYIITVIGVVFSSLFHIFVEERHTKTVQANGNAKETYESVYRKRNLSGNMKGGDSNQQSENSCNESHEQDKKWSDWLKNVEFYKVGFIYMMARLFVNLTQIYTPLYLQETLNLPKQSIAIVPFVTYVSGFVFSLIFRLLATKIGPKSMLTTGCFVGLASCTWILMGDGSAHYKQWHIYAVASLFGVGGTTMLIASLAIATDLIASNSTTGAFVFGSISFFDKLLNGVVVVILEQFNSKSIESLHEIISFTPVNYYQQVLVYASGSAVILTGLGLLLAKKGAGEFKEVEKDRRQDI